ncbi:Ca2+:H+ antiporter [Propionibacterium cyclohexanicum]|uniref:Ca2+:H+ antiporter n=1 Tax=Propionibacterium cyclohexanicum TaxID=64702 RepID=A0A1H9SAX2_9ACTN|nr:Ca2+:H+ antiporter [Propionibacterium cyclohexanicum]
MSALVLRQIRWTNVAPLVAFVALLITWNWHPPTFVSILLFALLVAAVLSAVHHAEVVAEKVGEPFGSLVLAVAVTVIEVGLILTLMAGGNSSETLARDTVFAAVMITVNGIIGICLVISSSTDGIARFSARGSTGALATVAALSGICLVLPSYTVSNPNPVFTPSQLAFAGISSLVLYAMFVSAQTGRHRSFFLPVDMKGRTIHTTPANHNPTLRSTIKSLVLLLIGLISVVGLAKLLSHTIELGVTAVGLPNSFVGVIIAFMVLAPETLAAIRAARNDRLQVSLNLALGSATASLGLTIPTLAVAMIWFPGELQLGLSPLQIVLLCLSIVIAILTVLPGRATRLQGGVHLVMLSAFIFLAANP